MKLDKKYILFDLDGTLTDSGLGITNAVKYSLRHFGIEETDTKKLNDFVGPPLEYSFGKTYGFDENQIKEAIEKYREYYKITGIYENKLYENTEESLEKLFDAGKKIILATSKPEVFAKTILDYFDITKYFYFVCGSELDGSRVEKGDVIKYIVDNLKINANDAVMIGDRKYDILGAKENNIESIGLTCGYGGEEELKKYNANYIFKNIAEALKILL